MEYHFSATRNSASMGVKTGLLASGALLLVSLFLFFGENRYISIDATRYFATTSGQAIEIPVALENRTRFPYRSADGFFLSGRISHMGSGALLDLPRTAIELKPREPVIAALKLLAPTVPGEYSISIDIVKEGEYWMASLGNRPIVLRLRVGG